MKKLLTITRAWFVTMPQHAYDATPAARQYAENLLDISVASSVQSLGETRDELNRIITEAKQLMMDYDQKSRGFHRSAMYKGRMLAFEDFINLLVREVKLYDQRIAVNSNNNGKTDDLG